MNRGTPSGYLVISEGRGHFGGTDETDCDGRPDATELDAVVDDSAELGTSELLLAGGAAGVVAKTISAPLSRLALLYQVDPSREFSLKGVGAVVDAIVRSEGVMGLWRGHVATLWRVVPFASVQFLVFDASHAQIQGWFSGTASCSQISPWHSPAAGALAGAVAASSATFLTYPLDVLRARAACHLGHSPRYMNYPAAVESILRTEGIRGLFRGLQPTMLGVVPYAAVSFSCFEALKQALKAGLGTSPAECEQLDIPIGYLLLAGCASGTLAQLVAYPLNVVRRRMQVEDVEIGARGSIGYVNTRSAFHRITQTEGPRGLFKGASLLLIKGPLTVGLAFVTNDLIKAKLIDYRIRKRDGGPFSPASPASIAVAEVEVDELSADLTKKKARELSAMERLVCGGIAGSCAKTIIAPGDRIKILYQTNVDRAFSWKGVYRTGRKIVHETGLRGLWRGHVATLLRVMPYSATSFAIFDNYKACIRWFAPSVGDVEVRFLAGAAAGATATIATYPLDLMRARMAAHWGREARYNSGYMAAFRAIVAEEGPRALWSGLRPTLLGIVPYSGLSFCFFETFKAKLVEYRRLDNEHQIGTVQKLGIGALAGLMAQSLTYPLDIVRRRMQVTPKAYRHEWDALQRIVRVEGAQALFKGLSMNWVKGPLAVGVSFSVNDKLRHWFAH